jgi:hypothetical protein
MPNFYPFFSFTATITRVASRIKWRNIAPQFVVPAGRNFMSIVVLCKKSCSEAGAAKGKQDASVQS